MKSGIPCKNPAAHGVQFHRHGTAAASECALDSLRSTLEQRFGVPTSQTAPDAPASDFRELTEEERYHDKTDDPQARATIDGYISALSERGYGYRYSEDYGDAIFITRESDNSYVTGTISEDGVRLSLWDDFGGDFRRGQFDNESDYLDRVEARYSELWGQYSA